MAQQVVTADELADKIAEAFQRGVKFGQMIERREHDTPNLRVVPTDQHTAQVFHLPTNDNSAA